jgi:hypothetical protein
MKKYLIITLLTIAIISISAIGIYLRYTQKQQPTIPASNSWIMDEITMNDEIPKNYWEWQEWFWFEGEGFTKEGKPFLIIHTFSTQVEGWFDYIVNGKSILGEKFPKGFNYSSSPIPTIWREIGDIKSELKFYDNGKRVHTITAPDYIINIETNSRGIPLWYSKGKDDVLPLVETPDKELFTFGGFDDAVRFNATITQDGRTVQLAGYGLYEHSWISPGWLKKGVAYRNWDWIVFYNAEMYGMLLETRSWVDNSPLTRTGRLGFPNKGEYYSFDDFDVEVIYSGRRLSKIIINGIVNGYTVDLETTKMRFPAGRGIHPHHKWVGTIWGEAITLGGLSEHPRKH